MLRSMYAGISGMKNFQTKLDVIGNNIANVNTSGFKKGRVTFQEMMSQTTTTAQAATETKGGVNASQVGLGSSMGSIDSVQTQGFRQTTNKPLDFSLEGDGMFLVSSNLQYEDFQLGADNPLNLENYNVNLNQSSNYYTRAGSFYLDNAGNVVNPQGLYLIGNKADSDGDPVVQIMNGNTEELYSMDGEGNFYGLHYVDAEGNEINIQDGQFVDSDGNPYDINEMGNPIDENGNPFILTKEGEAPATFDEMGLGDETTVDYEYLYSPINIPSNAQSFSIQTNGTVNYIDVTGTTQVAGRVSVANFSNPAGLQKDGESLYLNSGNAGYNGLFPAELGSAASVISGSLEMSNVDLAEEFTEMITAQRGFQANTRIITTSDEILQELVNLKR